MSDKKQLPDKCAVTRDLMPLCIDGTASDASQRKVKKHVLDCQPCATVYQEMQTQIDLDVPDQQETEQFDTAVKKVKHKHAWRRLRNVLLGVVLALVVCAGLAYGYYWYFLEEVPLPVDLYQMELTLRSPQSAETPVLIKTKNMPKPAKVHVEVHCDGSVMDDNGELQPIWVMYIWATTTRSVDLDSCGYTDYNYYAFDQTYEPGSYKIGNTLYKVNRVYNGAPEGEQILLFRGGSDESKLKWTSASNMVLRSVASLEVVVDEKVAAALVTPEVTVQPMRTKNAMATATPMPTATLVPATLPLYYNTTDQAIFYHVDRMCSSMDSAYLPLDGELEYRELKDDFNIGLQPCPYCNAPARNWD